MVRRDDTGMTGLWRTEVDLRVRELRSRLNVACASAPAAPGRVAAAVELLRGAVGAAPRLPDRARGAAFQAHAEAVHEALEHASTALLTPRWYQLRTRFRGWWTGEAITDAWESVHRAEAELVCIGSDADALAVIPQLRVWMKAVLSDASQLGEYAARFDEALKTKTPDRTLLRQAYQDTIAANVDWHSSLRSFRNVLFSVAVGLALTIAVIGTWHALHPTFVSLCRTVGATPTHKAHLFCFGDGPTSAGRAIFEIALIGAAGGLLSSAFLLGKLEHAPSRYNLLAPQIVLKALAGAVTALVGVLLVQSHVVVAPVGGDSTAELLAYAALFGFSQQLLTQFVDKRAGDLLGAKSS